MCNGWTNHETWLANVWLSEAGFDGRLESGDVMDLDGGDATTLEEAILEELELMTEVAPDSGLSADLFRSAYGAINTFELAVSYLEGLPERED